MRRSPFMLVIKLVIHYALYQNTELNEHQPPSSFTISDYLPDQTRKPATCIVADINSVKCTSLSLKCGERPQMLVRNIEQVSANLDVMIRGCGAVISGH